MLLPTEGRVRCNKHVQELIDIVKTLQYELLQHTSQIKIAITYLVPKVRNNLCIRQNKRSKSGCHLCFTAFVQEQWLNSKSK